MRKHYLPWLLPAVLLLSTLSSYAQDSIVQIDGTVLTPITIIKVGSYSLKYTYGVNPRERSLDFVRLAYYMQNGKRFDYNPFNRNVIDPNPVAIAITSARDAATTTSTIATTALQPGTLANSVALKSDLLCLHDGSRIECQITTVGPTQISYKRVNELTQYAIGRPAVQKIRFLSGRDEVISNRVLIGSSDDWENVVLTENPDEVVGLRRLGEVSGKSTGGFIGVKGVDKAASRKLKKEAAEMGGHIILLLQDQTSGSGLYRASKSFKSGIVYGYNRPATTTATR